jgi:hypothetical protein
MACTEPQCLYKGALYLYFFQQRERNANVNFVSAGADTNHSVVTSNVGCFDTGGRWLVALPEVWAPGM